MSATHNAKSKFRGNYGTLLLDGQKKVITHITVLFNVSPLINQKVQILTFKIQGNHSALCLIMLSNLLALESIIQSIMPSLSKVDSALYHHISTNHNTSPDTTSQIRTKKTNHIGQHSYTSCRICDINLPHCALNTRSLLLFQLQLKIIKTLIVLCLALTCGPNGLQWIALDTAPVRLQNHYFGRGHYNR